MKFDLKNRHVQMQMLFMAAFILLVVLLMIQQYKQRSAYNALHNIDTTKLLCISEVCLNGECIEVPGHPKFGKLVIKKSFNNPNVRQVVVQLYANKVCGYTEER